MGLTIIKRGKYFDVYAINHANRCPVQEFIDSLEKKDQKKVVALLVRLADYGMLGNDQKFHKLEGKGVDIWELKSFQVRIFCFFDKESLMILTHGFVKKARETPTAEIDKAIRLRKEFIEGKKK